MLEHLGQPNDYSDILKRIFFFTVLVGIGGTAIIAWQSPAVWDLVRSFKTEVSIGPVKVTHLVLVVVPMALALFSRIVKLHDRISDLLCIRACFDRNRILIPLAEGVNVDPATLDLGSRSDQKGLMYRVFYKYAGFEGPAIDAQLVRTALDQWGWFWVCIESSVMLVVLGLVSLFVVGWHLALWFAVAAIVLWLLAALLMPSCRRAADHEVQAILVDQQRRQEIAGEFNALQS